MGVALTLAANIMSFSFHAYQQELFPTGIRARAAGFVYSWSRLSVIFSSFIIAFVLARSGAFGVFVFIAAAMGVVMATIGLVRPAGDQSGAGGNLGLRGPRRPSRRPSLLASPTGARFARKGLDPLLEVPAAIDAGDDLFLRLCGASA